MRLAEVGVEALFDLGAAGDEIGDAGVRAVLAAEISRLMWASSTRASWLWRAGARQAAVVGAGREADDEPAQLLVGVLGQVLDRCVPVLAQIRGDLAVQLIGERLVGQAIQRRAALVGGADAIGQQRALGADGRVGRDRQRALVAR